MDFGIFTTVYKVGAGSPNALNYTKMKWKRYKVDWVMKN